MSGRLCNKSYQRYFVALAIIAGYFLVLLAAMLLAWIGLEGAVKWVEQLTARLPEILITVVAFWMGQAGHEAVQQQNREQIPPPAPPAGGANP